MNKTHEALIEKIATMFGNEFLTIKEKQKILEGVSKRKSPLMGANGE